MCRIFGRERGDQMMPMFLYRHNRPARVLIFYALSLSSSGGYRATPDISRYVRRLVEAPVHIAGLICEHTGPSRSFPKPRSPRVSCRVRCR